MDDKSATKIAASKGDPNSGANLGAESPVSDGFLRVDLQGNAYRFNYF